MKPWTLCKTLSKHNTCWSNSLCKARTFLLFSIVAWSTSSESSLSSLVPELFPKALMCLFFSTKHNKPLLHLCFTLPRPHPLTNDEAFRVLNFDEENLWFLLWSIIIITVESALASTRNGKEPIDAITNGSRRTGYEAKIRETQTVKTRDQRSYANGSEWNE